MAYDEASFKAGLATGRALWRLPYVVDKPLIYSWTADPAWIVSAAGTYLATVMYFDYPRIYNKLYNGKAIAFFRRNLGELNWNGPVVVSTVPRSTYVDETGSETGPEFTFQYLGLTWYANGGHAVDHVNTYYETPLHVFDNYPGTSVEMCIDALKLAKVRAVYDG